MRAVVLAYHSIGYVGLESLRRNGFEVVAVYTHADSPDENHWFRSVAREAALPATWTSTASVTMLGCSRWWPSGS
jgi:methionyl-tRNA formyltransferase